MPISREHARLNPATVQQLQVAIASPSFQRCWARPYRIDYTHTVPETSTYSPDGSVYYIDKDFYAAVKSGQIMVPHMTPSQIVMAALIQDRTEKCLIDSGQDGEPTAHEFGRLAEFTFVRKCGSTPKDFQAAIKKIVDRNRTKQSTIEAGPIPRSAPTIVPEAPPSQPQPQPQPQPPGPAAVPEHSDVRAPLHPDLKALADSTKATQDLVRELAQQRHGAPPEPAAVPEKPAEAPKPPKKKRKRRVKLSRDADGNLIADVEYDDEK